MASLNDDRFSRGFETARVLLGHRGFTSALAHAIRKPGGAGRAVRALLEEFGLGLNPFAISVEQTLDRFREANLKMGWGFKEGVFAGLAKSAPDWPKEPLAFRSLRIRWGEGDHGVEVTFHRHVSWVSAVLAPDFEQSRYLDSRSAYLRLLAGNETHRPAVEWVILDLGAHRERESVYAVRGENSVADEGLVFAWLFPEYVRSIDHHENPAFFLGGYEAWSHGDNQFVLSWRRAPVFTRYPEGKVSLWSDLVSHHEIGYTVPTILKQPHSAG